MVEVVGSGNLHVCQYLYSCLHFGFGHAVDNKHYTRPQNKVYSIQQVNLSSYHTSFYNLCGDNECHWSLCGTHSGGLHADKIGR